MLRVRRLNQWRSLNCLEVSSISGTHLFKWRFIKHYGLSFLEQESYPYCRENMSPVQAPMITVSLERKGICVVVTVAITAAAGWWQAVNQFSPHYTFHSAFPWKLHRFVSDTDLIKLRTARSYGGRSQTPFQKLAEGSNRDARHPSQKPDA